MASLTVHETLSEREGTAEVFSYFPWKSMHFAVLAAICLPRH